MLADPTAMYVMLTTFVSLIASRRQSLHPTLLYTYGTENNGALSFWDVSVQSLLHLCTENPHFLDFILDGIKLIL